MDSQSCVRAVLKEYLAREGWTCAPAADREEARKLLAARPFDVVLAQLGTPPEQDLEFLVDVRAAGPDSAVVMMGVQEDPELMRLCLESGADGFLPKPFDAAQMFSHILAAMGRRQLEKDKQAFKGEVENLVARRQKALLESERRYRALVETLNEGLFVANSDGRFTYANRRFCDLLNLPPGRVVGRSIRDFLDEDNQKILEKQGLSGGGDRSFELVWNRADDRKVYTLISPTRHGEGNEPSLEDFAVVTDITERKGLEKQLFQAQKLESLGQLTAGIAHEINTPLQYVGDNTRFVMDAFTDLTAALRLHEEVLSAARAGTLSPEKIRLVDEAVDLLDVEYLRREGPKAMAQTLEGIELVSRIVRSMKQFAHPGPETKTPTDINQAIETTITVARNEWKYMAEIHTAFAPDMPLVPCVSGELNQVILNMIINAAHAIADVTRKGAREKGVIAITTSHDGEWAQIRIADTGAGIPEDVGNRIFDPFFTTKEVGQGSGQGLAIAHTMVVDKHGGTIEYESEIGKGTTFFIRLPLKVQEA